MKDDTNQPGLSWSSPKSPAPQTAPKPTDASVPTQALVVTKSIVHSQAPVYAGLLVGGIIVGVLVGNAWTSVKQPVVSSTATSTSQSAAKNQGSEQKSTSSGAAPFAVADQKAGSDVAITGLSIKSPTWVVVHVSRGELPGNALGARLFFAGDKQGKVSLLRDTARGQTYFVGLRPDNGNRTFSLTTDKPLVGQDGEPVWATFKAL